MIVKLIDQSCSIILTDDCRPPGALWFDGPIRSIWQPCLRSSGTGWQLTCREVAQVKVVGRNVYQPLALDVCHRSNVVAGSQHKLLVHCPAQITMELALDACARCGL